MTGPASQADFDLWQAQLKKLFVFGYSSNSMPMLYWWAPKKPGDPEADFKMVRMMIYCIERAIDLCVAGVEYVKLKSRLHLDC